jgi:hypothetical protein
MTNRALLLALSDLEGAGVDQADAREWRPSHQVDVVTCAELLEHLVYVLRPGSSPDRAGGDSPG